MQKKRNNIKISDLGVLAWIAVYPMKTMKLDVHKLETVVHYLFLYHK